MTYMPAQMNQFVNLGVPNYVTFNTIASTTAGTSGVYISGNQTFITNQVYTQPYSLRDALEVPGVIEVEDLGTQMNQSPTGVSMGVKYRVVVNDRKAIKIIKKMLSWAELEFVYLREPIDLQSAIKTFKKLHPGWGVPRYAKGFSLVASEVFLHFLLAQRVIKHGERWLRYSMNLDGERFKPDFYPERYIGDTEKMLPLQHDIVIVEESTRLADIPDTDMGHNPHQPTPHIAITKTKCIDWTARQFDRKAEFPLIWEESGWDWGAE